MAIPQGFSLALHLDTRMNTPRALAITDLAFAYDSTEVFHGFSLSVGCGEIVALMGRSGCGKSTLLRLVAGLEVPQSGRIAFPNTDDGERARVSFVFEDYAAYPWLTVWENVLRGSGPRPLPSHDAVRQLLADVGLTLHLNKFPAELSAGMRKRLALARSLVRTPPYVLFDEPFSSLDVKLRFEMYELFQKLLPNPAGCALLVTHDVSEALILADRVLVLSLPHGKIVADVAVPFERPRSPDIITGKEFGELESLLIEVQLCDDQAS